MSVEPSSVSDILQGRVSKKDVRAQYAALCYRTVKNRTELLLITSRDTGRWIIPKGWPVAGNSPAQSAAQEAYEEAGVRGRVFDKVLGLYLYDKRVAGRAPIPCLVAVYPLKVKTLLDKFPEAGQRKRKWLPPAKAAQRVDEPDLARILKGFDPQSRRL